MTAAPHLLRRYGPAFVMALLIPALSLLPACLFARIAGPAAFPGADKLIHALMYAALAAALAHALKPAARARYRWAAGIALASALYGLAMEIGQQTLTDSRALDPYDALANLAGAFATALLACAWSRHRAKRQARASQMDGPGLP